MKLPVTLIISTMELFIAKMINAVLLDSNMILMG